MCMDPPKKSEKMLLASIQSARIFSSSHNSFTAVFCCTATTFRFRRCDPCSFFSSTGNLRHWRAKARWIEVKVCEILIWFCYFKDYSSFWSSIFDISFLYPMRRMNSRLSKNSINSFLESFFSSSVIPLVKKEWIVWLRLSKIWDHSWTRMKSL